LKFNWRTTEEIERLTRMGEKIRVDSRFQLMLWLLKFRQTDVLLRHPPGHFVRVLRCFAQLKDDRNADQEHSGSDINSQREREFQNSFTLPWCRGQTMAAGQRTGSVFTVTL
jgi:hypothetical protein